MELINKDTPVSYTHLDVYKRQILCIYQIADFSFQILFPFAIHHTTSRKFGIELYEVKQLFIIPLVYRVECVNLFRLVVYHIGMITELFA